MKGHITRGKQGKGRNGGKREARARLLLSPRPRAGLGEWLAAIVRGLDALEFLERSRELAAEAVVASPVRLPPPGR